MNPKDIPAFPNPRWEGWGSPQEGMTLRDYFAAKAMQGLINKYGFTVTDERLATDAYDLADAMLNARNSHAHDK
jgi:hypothetical protein